MTKLPYPWFGGKSKVAPYAWRRIGKVQNCVEPFFGGGAWTIACPLDPLPIRTINDVDGMVSNFWKAAGGYGSQADGGRGRDNSSREVIWFSPHCINGDVVQDALL